MVISKEISNIIVDPASFADWDKSHDAYTEIRRTSPLAIAEPDGFDPFWVVSKFDDILAVERDNTLFHNGDRSTVLTTIEADKQVREITGGSPHLVRSLVQMDNPDHMNYRRLTQGWFLPQNLRGLEDRIREIAREFIDKMLATGGECDFAREVAFPLPAARRDGSDRRARGR